MSKPTAYTKDQLYGATKSVKRTHKNKAVKREPDARISKVQAYKIIAQKIGLASDRSLWKNSDSDYLSKWYDTLIKEIDEIISNNELVPSRSTDIIDSDQKGNYLEVIAALEKRVEKLTLENLALRQKIKNF